jgi:tetratricopeptide (TPR) repeat protein
MNSKKAETVPGASQQERLTPNAKIMGGLAPGELANCPPKVAPVETDQPRPFWSVMIPAYNADEVYLTQTLRGVLAAGIDKLEMQIEVVDDASTKGDLAALVRAIAGDRVSVYRQPENLGQRRNWNSCLDRARGEWVHLLHADDLVLPDFYARMREQIEKNATLGAAFCRHGHIREDGTPVLVSDLERESPGVLEHWPQRLAVKQRIQPPSIVVRRSVYETLGGFWIAPGSCVDWEMWVRIAAHYPVLYHPGVMACYRLHASSGTSFLRQTAAMTTDAGKAIELFNAYFPEDQRDELMRLGKQHYARSACQSALALIRQNNYAAAIHHVEEALKLDPSPESAQLAEQVMAQLPASMLPGRDAPAAPGDFFDADEVKNIEMLMAAYHENPAEAATSEALRALRRGLCDFLLNADSGGLEALFNANFGTVYRLWLKSGFQNEPLTDEEAAMAEKLAGEFFGSFDFRNLLAFLLYHMAHHRFGPFELERIPGWFLDDYLACVLYSPQIFLRAGEAGQYAAHLLEWVRAIYRRTRTAPGAALTYHIAKYFAIHANFIPLYFVPGSTKELLARRADILEFFLKKSGAVLHPKFHASFPNHRKIKVGFLNAHFASQTETYSTLPTLCLDRTQFEICVFALASGGGPLEDHCRARADHFTVLPPKLADQVAAIRKAALDVILIGTNVTAVTNAVTLLAVHRLAPVQLLTNSAPVTSGMKSMDGYISGTFCESASACDQYTEKLLLLDGPAHCFDYTVDARPAEVRFDRERLGIPPDALVFVSGANCFKILPELMETWARILAQVEGSRLVLHPFNPNWSSAYPVRQFERSLAECFARHGVDRNRFILSSDRLPSRADVKELLRLGDIYLDSYPFAGVNSTVDPLRSE